MCVHSVKVKKGVKALEVENYRSIYDGQLVHVREFQLKVRPPSSMFPRHPKGATFGIWLR